MLSGFAGGIAGTPLVASQSPRSLGHHQRPAQWQPVRQCSGGHPSVCRHASPQPPEAPQRLHSGRLGSFGSVRRAVSPIDLVPQTWMPLPESHVGRWAAQAVTVHAPPVFSGWRDPAPIAQVAPCGSSAKMPSAPASWQVGSSAVLSPGARSVFRLASAPHHMQRLPSASLRELRAAALDQTTHRVPLLARARSAPEVARGLAECAIFAAVAGTDSPSAARPRIGTRVWQPLPPLRLPLDAPLTCTPSEGGSSLHQRSALEVALSSRLSSCSGDSIDSALVPATARATTGASSARSSSRSLHYQVPAPADAAAGAALPAALPVALPAATEYWLTSSSSQAAKQQAVSSLVTQASMELQEAAMLASVLLEIQWQLAEMVKARVLRRDEVEKLLAAAAGADSAGGAGGREVAGRMVGGGLPEAALPGDVGAGAGIAQVSKCGRACVAQLSALEPFLD